MDFIAFWLAIPIAILVFFFAIVIFLVLLGWGCVVYQSFKNMLTKPNKEE